MNRREFSKLFAAATGSLAFHPMGRIVRGRNNKEAAVERYVHGSHSKPSDHCRWSGGQCEYRLREKR